ncbi:MAG: ECF transporter S component [Sphaerochaeta sp.]|jgi:energy-coupling factor transport system substrate-specific component
MTKNERKQFSIKEDFSMLALLIVPVGVAVNFVGGQLASLLRLPLYLDTIGTIFVAMLCGPWVGAVTGLLTNILTGIANPVNFAFIPVAIIAGLVTGAFARHDYFSVWWKWLIAMVVMGAASILSAAPIVVLMFGGVTGSGASLITATFMAAGANIWGAFIGTEGLFNVLDRIISVLICLAVIKVIPNRNLIKFSCGMFYVKDREEIAEVTE